MPLGRGLIGPRTSITLVFAAALLSIATGVANMATAATLTPLAAIFPDVARTVAGFTGTLTGFVLLVAALGLHRRLRAAWIATAVLLPVTATQGLVQSSPYSLPLVALSLVAAAVLLVTRDRFTLETDLSSTQFAALIAVLGVQLYGTAGAYALRDQYTGITTVTDAFYYTIITASTVGYGDVTPATEVARLFGMTVVLLGTASFALALGSLLGPAIEGHLSKALGRMTDTHLSSLERHVIVLGYGDLSEPLLEELPKEKTLVVTDDPDRAELLRERGYNVLTGDPSDEETLERANIDTALAVVAATESDADDALAILTARHLNPDARIVSAATDRENVEKLRKAGADTVISPTAIGAHLLVQSATREADVESIAENILREKGREDPTP